MKERFVYSHQIAYVKVPCSFIENVFVILFENVFTTDIMSLANRILVKYVSYRYIQSLIR